MNLVECAKRIRAGFPASSYDHRPFLPPGLPSYYHSEEFRVGYACFKREVAHVLQPKTIVEIGVGVGVSALAFLDGSAAEYIGIDNDCESGRDFPVTPSEFVKGLVGSRGTMIVADSANMKSISPCDLVHIDGCHGYTETVHDITLAWDTGALWILVDDCRDSIVAAATMEVIRYNRQGSIEWAYFEDTYTGSILISREVGRP